MNFVHLGLLTRKCFKVEKYGKVEKVGSNKNVFCWCSSSSRIINGILGPNFKVEINLPGVQSEQCCCYWLGARIPIFFQYWANVWHAGARPSLTVQMLKLKYPKNKRRGRNSCLQYSNIQIISKRNLQNRAKVTSNFHDQRSTLPSNYSSSTSSNVTASIRRVNSIISNWAVLLACLS